MNQEKQQYQNTCEIGGEEFYGDYNQHVCQKHADEFDRDMQELKAESESKEYINAHD